MNQVNTSLETSYLNKTDRLFALDFLKAISIISVVSFHSIVVPRTTYISNELVINLIFAPFRFCVPVFLTISFLLLEKTFTKSAHISNWSIIQKRLTRLLMPIFFWFSLTAFLKLINQNPWHEVVGMILNGEVFTGGYYLLILLQFYVVFVAFRPWFDQAINVLIVCIMQMTVYSCIYSIHSHPELSPIITTLQNIHRPLFIYWFIYPALGIFAYKKWPLIVKISSQISLPIKSIIIAAYILVQCCEFYYQSLTLQAKIPPFDYAMFSCVFSVFVMLICFASVEENTLHPLVKKSVVNLSKYSLGIFCINGILYQILLSIGIKLFSEAHFNLMEIIVIKLVTWILLLTVSFGLSILLDRIGFKAVVR